MTNIEKLTADIRQKLPRLMELTDGCLFIYEEQTYKIDGFYRKHEHGYLYFNGDILFNDQYDIIGHPVMLNDVLEWYLSKRTDSMLLVSEDNNIFIGIHKHNRQLWDLSKPYLRDQSHELIDYLAGLIQ